MNEDYKKGMEEWVKGCEPKPKSELQPNQLNFYEYKWIRSLLKDILKFQEKNYPNGIMPDHKESIPYFVYQCEPKYLQKLIDKMTNRMEEFEPWVSKNTTAHTGYWDV